MFIGGMTNEHIRTGLPSAFFVLWLPSGPQWKQCCSASNTHMLPDASESQKQELGALLVSLPPQPPPIYCMVTKHADRQSKSRQPGLCSCLWRLTSAPDKISQPCPQQLLRAHARLGVCKVCNWRVDICIHIARHAAKISALFSLCRSLTHKETVPPCTKYIQTKIQMQHFCFCSHFS